MSGNRLLRLIVPIPQGKGFRGKALWVGRRILCWYLLLLVMLAFFQRSLIYHPTRAANIDPNATPLGAGWAKTVTVRTDDGLELHGWHVAAAANAGLDPAIAQSPGLHPVVIYFPGNAGHRGNRAAELALLSRLGADVYLVDYRGYGDNPGRPSEVKLAADARAVWRSVVSTHQVDSKRIVLVGESLGGAVATRLAMEMSQEGTPPAGLILKATFSSLPDVASYHFPWLPARTLLIDRYPSADRIRDVTCPILEIHGTSDTLVPIRYGRRLFDAAPGRSAEGVPKTFVELAGAGHNDILFVARDAYRLAIRDFFSRLPSRDSRSPTPAPRP